MRVRIAAERRYRGRFLAERGHCGRACGAAARDQRRRAPKDRNGRSAGTALRARPRPATEDHDQTAGPRRRRMTTRRARPLGRALQRSSALSAFGSPRECLTKAFGRPYCALLRKLRSIAQRGPASGRPGNLSQDDSRRSSWLAGQATSAQREAPTARASRLSRSGGPAWWPRARNDSANTTSPHRRPAGPARWPGGRRAFRTPGGGR